MFVGVGRLRTRFHARGLGEDGRCVRKRGYRLFHVVEFFLFRSFFVHSFERAVPFRAPAPAPNETKMSARPQTAPRAMASSSDGASIVVADAPATIPSTESATAVVLASRSRERPPPPSRASSVEPSDRRPNSRVTPRASCGCARRAGVEDRSSPRACARERLCEGNGSQTGARARGRADWGSSNGGVCER